MRVRKAQDARHHPDVQPARRPPAPPAPPTPADSHHHPDVVPPHRPAPGDPLQLALQRDFETRPRVVRELERMKDPAGIWSMSDPVSIPNLVGMGVPSLIDMVRHGHNSIDLEKAANPKDAMPLVAGFAMGGPHFERPPAPGLPEIPRRSSTDLKIVKKRVNVAKRIDTELAKSPVRQQAHAHFDQTAPTPEAAQVQKDLWDAKVHELAQNVFDKPKAVRQVVDHLQGKGVVHAAQQELGDLHFLYQSHPLPVAEMPARIKGGPVAQKVYKLVKQGAQYRDWYQRASWVVNLAAKAEGISYDQMAQIVAITSQGANPTFNLRLALEAVQNYKKFGRVQIGPKAPYIFNPAEVEAVLKGGEWSGRKRSSFYQNITRETDHVTVDRHIAQMIFKTDSPTAKQYDKAEAIFRDIAAQMGWSPKEVQAAAWVPWKAASKAAQIAKRGGAAKPVEAYMPAAGDAYEAGYANAVKPPKLRPLGSKAKLNPLTENELNRVKLGYEEKKGSDLQGLPTNVKYRGEEIPVHSNAQAQSLAADYMREAGLPYDPPHTYAKVDKERAKRIAEWYDKAVDAPNDPAVRAAYDAMAQETLKQYDVITRAGYTFEFYPEGGLDPYPGGPREAMIDLQQNKHMYVFPTDAGFGTENAAASTHPLLGDSGLQWGGKPVTHNDVFRAVHDFFGHFKEGVGFRADGEENAWRAHSAMYSEQARPAMTAETRGQNSWVNFGPHGEANRTAMQDTTVYADQKAVLAPDWVVNDGAHDPGRKATTDLTVGDILSQAPPEPSGLSFGDHAKALLDEHAQAALDIARLLPEDQWPAWVRNQIRTQAVGRDVPVELPNPTSPLDQNLGPTQRYTDWQEAQKHGMTPAEFQQYQDWLAQHGNDKPRRFFTGGGGLSSGIPIGGNEDAALFEIGGKKEPKLSPKEELQQHPIRLAAHENIAETYGDPQLQKALQDAYDKQVLADSEKAGMTPGEFLEKRAEVQPAAAAKVMAGMRGDKMYSKRTAQEAGYKQERGRRFGDFAEALKANPTLEGFAQASEHLKGALPKLETNGIRGLTEDEVDSLVAHVAIHPALSEGEKKRVLDAVRAAWIDGKVPTRSEYKLMNEAFGTKFTNAAFAPHVLSKYRRLALDALNLPRSLMASFDVSAPFRQGLIAFARHPLMTGKNLGPMFKYLTSEKGYHDYMETLQASPDFAQMKEDGLAITDVEDSLLAREEQFQSHLAETLTGGKKFSPVRASGRAYTGFLVKTRVDMYRYLLKTAAKQGRELDAEARSQLANYINAATGRGDLGRFERDAVTMNALMFSPRLMASRLNFLDPRAYFGLDPFVRRQKIRAAIQTAGAVSATLWLASNVAGVKVSINPMNSDFGKIRIGNTRIDVAGGFVQYIRVLSALGAGLGHSVGIGKGNAEIPAQVTRFLRGKASPIASIAADSLTDTNYAGQQLKPGAWKKELYDSFIPLVVQDIRDTYRQTGSVPAAVGAAAASGTGIGVQSYGAKAKKKARSNEQKASDWQHTTEKELGVALPPDVVKASHSKATYQDAEKELKKHLGVTKLTDEQRTGLKLQLVVGLHPELAQTVQTFKASLGDEHVRASIDRWAEKTLEWNLVDAFSREASKMKEAHAASH